ncbi:MAG: serine/threonine-protein kinase [Chitinophagales bacterium]
MSIMTVKKTYEFDPNKDLIGTGGFGKVFRARDVNLDMVVALKKYTGSLPTKYSLFEEIKRVIQLNHPNLVRYYDAFELEESSTFGDKIQVGVMELINGGDLMKILKQRPNEAVLRDVFIGIMRGIKYLHDRGIIHRDLKPENILIHIEQDGTFTPKIVDFGISKVLEDSNTAGASSMIIGSIEYMAPEQFNMKRYGNKGKLHTNLDLWSLGAMMYEAFTGEAPFGKTKLGVARDEIMRNILQKGRLTLERIPNPYRRVIERCLVRDAGKRAQSVEELLKIMGDTAEVANNTGSTTVLPKDSYNTSVMDNPYADRIRNKINPISTGGSGKVTDSSSSTIGISSSKNVEATKSSNLKSSWDDWQWGFITPMVTALLGYSAFNSKKTFFGFETPEADYVFYFVILMAVLCVVNLFSVFIRNNKRAFEWVSYTASFLVLIYYLVQSFMIFQLGGTKGMKFDFAETSFSQSYPWIGIIILILSIGVAVFMPKK